MSHVTGQVTGEDGDDAANPDLACPEGFVGIEDGEDSEEFSHHRRSRGTGTGRRAAEHKRSARVALVIYPSDHADLEAIAEAWGVPLSTLGWSVLHEWLSAGRGVRAELGDARGALWLCVEMALKDAELSERLRRRVAGDD